MIQVILIVLSQTLQLMKVMSPEKPKEKEAAVVPVIPVPSRVISKSKSKLPLPPVQVPDWTKPAPKPGVRRALNFDDDAAGSSSSPTPAASSPTPGTSSPKPVDPVSDPKIPVVDLAAEPSTGARRKDTLLLLIDLTVSIKDQIIMQ